jgi:hypothetical protein
MPDVTAASSPATEIPSLGSSLTPEIKAAWDKGEHPTPKAESAPAPESATSAQEGEAVESETAPESETGKPVQETKPKGAEHRKPKPTAEERIAQLEQTIEKIRKGAGLETKTQAEPSPAKPEPKPQPQYTRPKPTTDDKDEKGNPKYSTYEDYVEDLADWKAEQRIAQQERERVAREQAREFKSKVSEAKGRYENFDEVVQPALTAIVSDEAIPQVVKVMLNDSEVLPDLLFTIGSKPEELASFVKMAKQNTGKALRYIALTESLIQEELAAPKAPPKVEKPAEPVTKAPKPPSEVGGRGTAPADTEEEAVKANDYRKASAAWNRRLLASMKS